MGDDSPDVKWRALLSTDPLFGMRRVREKNPKQPIASIERFMQHDQRSNGFTREPLPMPRGRDG